MAKTFQETDLYPPLKAWLEAGGFTVRAEVGGCDIAACKGDDLVLVEMKRAINLDLLLQLLKRQETHASVYAAVPAPKTQDKRWRALARLVKRLECGLLLVYLDSRVPRVELAFDPAPPIRRKVKSATRAILKEIAGRSMDLNKGGSNRTKLVTRYREQALTVAVALSLSYPASPKELRQRGAPENTGAILRDNHYDWFSRLGKGKYTLTMTGKKALDEYVQLTDRIHEALAKDKQKNTME